VTDIDGHPRIVGGIVDLGAYEDQGPRIVNGGFETGNSNGWLPADWHDDWTSLEVTPFVSSEWLWARAAPHSGSYSRMIDCDLQANSRRDFYQNVDLSDGYCILSFWLNADLNPNGGLSPGTWAGAELREANGGQLIASLAAVGADGTGHCGTSGWQRFEVDLSPHLQRQMADGGDLQRRLAEQRDRHQLHLLGQPRPQRQQPGGPVVCIAGHDHL
jgi:hypothetical protein